jgi:F-type H+-transporting ATPase subunit b
MAQQTTTAEVSHDAGANAGFPPFESGTFPSQLLWLAICFGALYWFMSRKALPQVGAVIEARKSRIAKDIDDATALQQRAEAAAAAHEQSMADARSEAQRLAQAARENAAAQADAQRKQVEGDLATKLSAAEQRIGATRNAAMANVDQIARDAAGAIVEHLIGRTAENGALDQAIAAAKAN